LSRLAEPRRVRRPVTNYLHEVKAEGYRAQLSIQDGAIVVYSRRG
jgi:ATP-dependent DNA ligase